MTTAHTKQFNAAFKAASGQPDDTQLAVINDYTLAVLTSEEVYVRTAYIAHNAIDRDQEVFDDALLDVFARTLPGKGLFVKHPRGWDGDSGPGVGRWFGASVVEMSLDDARKALRQPGLQWPPGTEVAKLLEGDFYIPRTNGNDDLIKNVDAGVASDVSIGFSAADRVPITDHADKVIAMRWVSPGEALETSLVWLGAQPGARAHKDLSSNNSNEETDAMSAEQLKVLQDAKDALQKKHDDLKTATAKALGLFDAIKNAFKEELTNNTDAVIKAINDGLAYHKTLVADVIAAERKAGLIGDTPEETTAAEKAYGDWGCDKLKAWAVKLNKTAAPDDGGSVAGGDPNASAADKDAAQNKDANSPFNNEAVTGVKAA